MFDLVILNGNIIDPIDGEYQKNIGIKDGKIVEISDKNLSGKEEIDLEGKKIAPGFIDIHMHEDELINGVIKYDTFNFMALMGVTTAVGGNCGLGCVNIKEYLSTFDKQGAPVNYAGLIGNAKLREYIGCDDRYHPAKKDEIKKMGEIIKEGMQNGALGLSFGLEYTPGVSTEEFMELSKIVSEYPKKMVACHYRFDAIRSLEALSEMIIVARETKVKFEISHIGSCIAFGQMEEGLKMLDAAIDSGIDIMADLYPYNAFATYIGTAVFDPGCFERWGVGYDAIQIADGKYSGQRCNKEIFDYLRENEPNTMAVAFVMNDDEVSEAMKNKHIMIGSDGLMANGLGHPRGVGTFPRVLGKYVRQEHVIDLITAINKMTYMPAQRLGLKSKGRIKEGYDADITIFDYEKVIDNATFEKPNLISNGIEYVIVNGVKTVVNGNLTGSKPGISIKF